jgi:hypothetical protein
VRVCPARESSVFGGVFCTSSELLGSVRGPIFSAVPDLTSRFKPEHLDRLNAWCDEEMAALKAKGATDDFLTEPSFADLLLAQVLNKHWVEIKEDAEFAREVFMALYFDKATPAQLREMATEFREKGDADLAYFYETAADRRERGEL